MSSCFPRQFVTDGDVAWMFWTSTAVGTAATDRDPSRPITHARPDNPPSAPPISTNGGGTGAGQMEGPAGVAPPLSLPSLDTASSAAAPAPGRVLSSCGSGIKPARTRTNTYSGSLTPIWA